MKNPFPKDFLFGVATSSFQIEGNCPEIPKEDSIWDVFCRKEGAIRDGSDATVACDHIHRYKEDVQLIKNLGAKGYRFSIAWPRVIHTSTGKVNDAGMDFYKRLCDELLENGIEPYVTLFHWDLPQSFQETGGWTNRDIVNRFCDFTSATVKSLGDRVKNWYTHNEMWCTAFMGHAFGHFAPGISDYKATLATAHHCLLSHGRAVPVIRQLSSNARVGAALNYNPAYPLTDSEKDKQAARNWDGYFNRWFFEPVALGRYPEDMLELYKDYLPEIREGDLKEINQPLDFMGVNYYDSMWTSYDEYFKPLFFKTHQSDQREKTADREIWVDGMTDTLVRIHNDYRFPELYITENGAAFSDQLIETESGPEIQDPERQKFYQDHLMAAYKVIEKGVPLKGFFLWSLMDNFEWNKGYTLRYGIYYTDYPSQRRILKNSGKWLKEFLHRT